MSKSRDRIFSVVSVLSVGLAGAFIAGMAALTPAQAAHEEVAFQGDYPAGVVVISKHQRRLYFTEGNGRAIRYPVAVGMPGKAWLGETSVAAGCAGTADRASSVIEPSRGSLQRHRGVARANGRLR